MEAVRKLESTMAEWYAKAPHLPKNGQDWIAKNVWWLVMIGAILGAFAVISILWVTVVGVVMLTGFGGLAGAALGGLALVMAIVTLAFTAMWVVLAGMAVKPLRAGEKKGWDLLFISLLLNAVVVAITFIFSVDVGGLLSGVIGLALGGYVLFEVRKHFAGARATNKKASKTPTATTAHA